MRVTTKLTTINGGITTSSSAVDGFKMLLDKTYDILKERGASGFTSLPMWLFESYSKMEEVQNNKELYAPQKYALIKVMRNELYNQIFNRLGADLASRIFDMRLSVNSNYVNDKHLEVPMLRIA